jgi:hypothetical protein
MSIYNTAGGFWPVSEMKLIKSFTVGGTDVKQGSAVQLSGGEIIPVATTGAGQIGVALAAGTDGDIVPVCIDFDTIYEILSGDDITAVDDIGKCALIDAAETSTAGTIQSTMKLDMSAATATLTANHVCICVGIPTSVTNIAAASNKRVLVKLIANNLNRAIYHA